MESISFLDGGSARWRGEMKFLSLIDLWSHVTEADGAEEEIIDVEVRIADKLAMVWAPYEVTRYGKFSQSGTNVMALHKVDGEWKISGVADTGQNLQGSLGKWTEQVGTTWPHSLDLEALLASRLCGVGRGPELLDVSNHNRKQSPICLSRKPCMVFTVLDESCKRKRSIAHFLPNVR